MAGLGAVAAGLGTVSRRGRAPIGRVGGEEQNEQRTMFTREQLTLIPIIQ